VKVNIVRASWYRNGKRVVEELAGLLQERKQDLRVFSLMEGPIGTLPAADLYILSSPTRTFNLPANVKEFIASFTPPNGEARYALVTTYLDPRTIGLKKMADALEAKGMRRAAGDLKIKALGLKGPLEKEYGKKLAAFADDVLKA